jgi:sterol desaturase/sphingolipid hydroxylase (fatty acid hydroxylase superfamily)
MPDIANDVARTLGLVVITMSALAVLELAVPLHARGAWNKAHFKPNLALTSITLFTSVFLNSGVVLTLIWLGERDYGLMNGVSLSPLVATTIVVMALDLATYGAHRALHEVPALWRLHRVHHSDPVIDVTTTIRQHPGEGLVRYLVLFVVAAGLGASPAAFGVYRVVSTVTALFEHANVRLPQWLDTALSWVTTWPNAHKVHHSRLPAQTDSNYGNVFSWWDRLFGTFTPSHVGPTVVTGLDETDTPSQQTTRGLLAMPFANATASSSSDRPAALPSSR